MTKTEQAMHESIAKRGYFYAVSKRAYDVIERLKRTGKLDGFHVSFGCENINGPKWKSQWKNPRSRLVYDVTVRPL
jgi:hypothetical protein